MDSGQLWTVRSALERPRWEDIVGDVETLLSRERMLRLRAAHLRGEAERAELEAAECPLAAWVTGPGQFRTGEASC